MVLARAAPLPCPTQGLFFHCFWGNLCISYSLPRAAQHPGWASPAAQNPSWRPQASVSGLQGAPGESAPAPPNRCDTDARTGDTETPPRSKACPGQSLCPPISRQRPRKGLTPGLDTDCSHVRCPTWPFYHLCALFITCVRYLSEIHSSIIHSLIHSFALGQNWL